MTIEQIVKLLQFAGEHEASGTIPTDEEMDEVLQGMDSKDVIAVVGAALDGSLDQWLEDVRHRLQVD